jgi:hypothetical protein
MKSITLQNSTPQIIFVLSKVFLSTTWICMKVPIAHRFPGNYNFTYSLSGATSVFILQQRLQAFLIQMHEWTSV